jgi:hypothetical protein
MPEHGTYRAPDAGIVPVMRVGVWLSGIAAGLAFVVGGLGAIDGLPGLLIPAVASLVTVFAWVERRTPWWGVVAVAAHWTPLLLLAVAAWDWVWLGAPLVPGALTQSIALVAYTRSDRARPSPAHP